MNITDGDDYGEGVDPWEITLVDDLMVHCHESFPEEFNELYVDMLSACVSVFLFAIVSKTCFTPKPLDFMDHVFMGLFGFLVVFNGVCYVLTIIDAGHSLNSRCGFHLLIAMPLSKGYFFTSVAVMDYLGNTTLFRGAAHGKKAGVKDRVAGISEQIVDSYCMCLFWIGFGSFALVETVFSLISLMYTLPLLVTLWLPIFILFLSIPLAVYCILFPIIVGGDDEKRIRYVDSITVIVPQFLAVFLTLAAVHLSRIYYVEYEGVLPFHYEYMEIWDGTWGHFWPGIDFSKWWYSWAWPTDLAWYPQLSLGMSAVTISAGKVNQARRALGYAEMVSNAKSAALAGQSAMASKGEEDKEGSPAVEAGHVEVQVVHARVA